MNGYYSLDIELSVKATERDFLMFYFLACKDKVLQMIHTYNPEGSKFSLVLASNLLLLLILSSFKRMYAKCLVSSE
jgi:hypothetical protein